MVKRNYIWLVKGLLMTQSCSIRLVMLIAMFINKDMFTLSQASFAAKKAFNSLNFPSKCYCLCLLTRNLESCSLSTDQPKFYSCQIKTWLMSVYFLCYLGVCVLHWYLTSLLDFVANPIKWRSRVYHICNNQTCLAILSDYLVY